MAPQLSAPGSAPGNTGKGAAVLGQLLLPLQREAHLPALRPPLPANERDSDGEALSGAREAGGGTQAFFPPPAPGWASVPPPPHAGLASSAQGPWNCIAQEEKEREAEECDPILCISAYQ